MTLKETQDQIRERFEKERPELKAGTTRSYGRKIKPVHIIELSMFLGNSEEKAEKQGEENGENGWWLRPRHPGWQGQAGQERKGHLQKAPQ